MNRECLKDKGILVNWKETIVDVSIYFFVILSIFEAVILSYWILLTLGVIETGTSLGQELVKQEANIFYITAAVTPILFTITIFTWVAKPVLNIISKTKLSHRFQNKSLPKIQHIFTLRERLDRRDVTLLVLLCSMAAATLLALFPYSPALNPNLHTIGTDTNAYASNYLARMENQSSLLETVTYTFTKLPDRALGLLFMYAFHQIIGGSRLAVSMFFPILLAPLTVLSTYFFVREARFSNIVASLAVVFTAFSFYLVTGTVAGLLSNWMAIILIYIFSGLLIKSIRQNSTFYGFMAALIGVLVLLTHGSSWSMLMGVIVVYGLLQVVGNRDWKSILSSWELNVSTMIVLVNLAAQAIRNYLLSLGPRIEGVGLAQTGMSLQNLANYWTILDQTFFLYMFKTFLNPMILFLVLVGALALLNNDEQPAPMYLVSWFIASAIPFTLSDLVLQSRIMYNLPISIMAAYGASALLTPLKNTIEPKRFARLKSAIIAAIILTGLNYALRLIFEVLSYYVSL